MPGAAEDDAAGREVGAGNDVDQLVDAEARIVDQRDAGVDHLAEIVRRDVGRHADRDAALLRSPAGSGSAPAAPPALSRCRRSSAGNRPCPCRCRRAVPSPAWPAGIRCSAWPRADRRRPNRNFPARRSAAGAWRNPAPCAPARRRSPGRRAEGICPSRRRPRAPTSRISCRACARSRAWNRGCADAPA